MASAQLSLPLDLPHPLTPPHVTLLPGLTSISPAPAGDKTKARDILAAIRALQTVEREQRPAFPEERQALARFGGFGAVALSMFPDPVTGRYSDAGWQVIGEDGAIEVAVTDELHMRSYYAEWVRLMDGVTA